MRTKPVWLRRETVAEQQLQEVGRRWTVRNASYKQNNGAYQNVLVDMQMEDRQ